MILNKAKPTSLEIKDLPIADPKGIEELKKTLGSETASEVISGFFELVEENIKHALEALENKDYAAFELHCHTIKSNAAYLGGKRLQQICANIENAHAENDIETIKSCAPLFKICCAETISELKKIIQ